MSRFKKVVKQDVFHFTRVQKILIGICIFFLSLGLVTRVMQGNAVSKFGYSTFSMFRYSIIEKPIASATGFLEEFGQLWNVKNENDELRNKLSSQPMYKDERDDALRKVEEMEAIMQLTDKTGYTNVYAMVLNRDVQGWSNTITIDRGSDDGVKVDRAVICSKGLIGRVTAVSKTTSTVKLLTTEYADNSVAIKVVIDEEAQTTAEGFLDKFNKETGMYEIRLVDSNANIEKGMKIVSAGAGGVFPSGITVGTVEEVTDLYDAEGKSVKVKPSVNFNSFQYLSVLVDK